jgi:hypothetical protein
MDLDENGVQEFIRLWKEEFNETISSADARHCASGLLELFAVLTKPLPSERHSSGDGNALI